MGEKFNENLRTFRENKNFSQKEIAEKLGVAKSTYSLYESGNREPSVENIKKIADALDVSVDELFGRKGEIHTIAAHFDGDEFTTEELEEIKQFAAFVKNRNKVR